MKPRTLGLIIYGLIALGISFAAKAETTAHSSLPSNEITASDAMKKLAASEPVYRCTKKIAGPSINPVKVKGSKETWHTAVGKGMDEAFDALADSKAVYFCELVYGDSSSGRVRKVQD